MYSFRALKNAIPRGLFASLNIGTWMKCKKIASSTEYNTLSARLRANHLMHFIISFFYKWIIIEWKLYWEGVHFNCAIRCISTVHKLSIRWTITIPFYEFVSYIYFVHHIFFISDEKKQSVFYIFIHLLHFIAICACNLHNQWHVLEKRIHRNWFVKVQCISR